MGVEVPQRQALHLVEHLVADLPQDPLGDDHHQAGVEESGQGACQTDACHHHHGVKKGLEIRRLGTDQRHDEVVDKGLQEHRGGDGGERVDEDAEDHHDKQHTVPAFDIGQQPLQGRACVFCLAAARGSAGRTHVSSPPFTWDS